MIVVTHLLGSGHLARAVELARAFGAEGHEAHVVSGGRSAPHIPTGDISLHPLPPVYVKDADFSVLYSAAGIPVTAEDLATRKSELLAIYNGIQPDILITELFPFGRRNLKSEFETLLAHAHHQAQRPAIFASVRDILAPPSKASKAEYAAETVANFYDGILVHSDPSLIRLDLSWPLETAMRKLVHYTGFIAPRDPIPVMGKSGEIIVSAGGGDVGMPVFELARKAAQMAPEFRWRLLVGGTAAEQHISQLRSQAPAQVHIEAARPDFRSLLAAARATVSLCGYNTAMDILQTGVPAVFLPYDEGGEVEQTLRAQALGKMSGIEVLKRATAQPEDLLSALERARKAAPRQLSTIGFSGARETVRICISERVSDVS